MIHTIGIQRRKIKIRSRIKSTLSVPRLVVKRTGKHIYAQLIDNKTNRTIISFDDTKLNLKESEKPTKSVKAKMVGSEIGKLALKKEVKAIVFDRSGYRYHGRIKALAEGARESGLKF